MAIFKKASIGTGEAITDENILLQVGENFSINKTGKINGNIDASQIYFDEDMIFTHNFGNYTVDANGTVVIPVYSQNMSLKDLLLSAFSNGTTIKITAPKFSISSPASTTITIEVGETIAPSYTLNFTQGAYPYGTKTNSSKPAPTTVNPIYTVMFNNETKTAASGTFTAVSKNTSTSLTLNASVTWNDDNAIPLDALGREMPSAILKAPNSPLTDLVTYKWIKYCFYGHSANAINITSENIRNLNKLKSENPESTVVLNSQWRYFYYAVPGTRKIIKAKDSNDMELGIKTVEIDVSNASNTGTNKYTVSYIENKLLYNATTLTLTWG